MLDDSERNWLRGCSEKTSGYRKPSLAHGGKPVIESDIDCCNANMHVTDGPIQRSAEGHPQQLYLPINTISVTSVLEGRTK